VAYFLGHPVYCWTLFFFIFHRFLFCCIYIVECCFLAATVVKKVHHRTLVSAFIGIWIYRPAGSARRTREATARRVITKLQRRRPTRRRTAQLFSRIQHATRLPGDLSISQLSGGRFVLRTDCRRRAQSCKPNYFQLTAAEMHSAIFMRISDTHLQFVTLATYTNYRLRSSALDAIIIIALFLLFGPRAQKRRH